MSTLPHSLDSGNRGVYAPRPVKRKRRDTTEIEAIKGAIIRIVEADHAMTRGGLFYRLVSEGMIGKAENEYKNVGRYLLQLRRDDRLPYTWIADNTRWMRKPRTYSGLKNAMELTAATYRRGLWDNHNCYVEVWCEKDTLAGVLTIETEPYDVPLMVVRGFASETYLYQAAQTIRQAGKPAHLYVL